MWPNDALESFSLSIEQERVAPIGTGEVVKKRMMEGVALIGMGEVTEQGKWKEWPQ